MPSYAPVMSKRKRVAAARMALQAIMDAGGEVEQRLAAIEVLRARDRQVFQACEKLIRANNAPRAIKLLDQMGGKPVSTPSGPGADPELVSGLRRAAWFSRASWLTWAVIAASLWLTDTGVGVSIAIIVPGWAVSVQALRVGGDIASRVYEHYSGLGEYLGALVFLAVPLMLPIGLIWTVARAARIRSGLVDGPGHNPSPGGGYGYFEKGNIGDAGRPIASALFALAIGHSAAVAALVVRLLPMVLSQ